MPDNMKQEHDNLSHFSKQSFKENNNCNICGSKIWRYLFLIKDSTVSMIIQFLHFPVMLNYVSGLYVLDTSLWQKCLKFNENFIPKILWEISPPLISNLCFIMSYTILRNGPTLQNSTTLWWASGCRRYGLKLSSLSWFEEKYLPKFYFKFYFKLFSDFVKKIYSI